MIRPTRVNGETIHFRHNLFGHWELREIVSLRLRHTPPFRQARELAEGQKNAGV